MMKEKSIIETNKSKKTIIICIILFLAFSCFRPAKSDYAMVYILISIGFLTAAAYLIIYRYLAWYSYQLTENELLIIRNIGSHEKYLMIARFDKIAFIKPNDEPGKKVNFPVGNKLYGEYSDGGRTLSFTFSPSDEMIKKLKTKLNDRFLG